MSTPALLVRDLRVRVPGPGLAPAVDGIDLTIAEGATVGLVGESGSGKSMLAASLVGLQPGGAEASWAALSFGERSVTSGTRQDWRAVRGEKVSMVFQDSRTALSSVLSVGAQLTATLRAATGSTPSKATMASMLDRVGIASPDRRLNQYTHQLSGGIRQRVAIALALAWSPRLLIADEPTTALDVTVQRQVVELLKELQSSTGMAILFVSHDLGVVSQLCESLVVMYAGRVVERGATAELVDRPDHPYTEGLLRSVPEGDQVAQSISGTPPSLADRPTGCAFHPRCPHAFDRCRVDPPVLNQRSDAQGEVACWLRIP